MSSSDSPSLSISTPAAQAPSDAQLMATLSATQKNQLEQYVDALLVANAQFNLTAVRSREEAWERHVVESLRLLSVLGTPHSLLDVGSGGGLPGMILAIARPEIQVTLLEATRKKANFLREVADEIGAKNVQVICDRAENAAAQGQPLRQKFDMVSARAVAPLRTLLELTIPFLRVKGTLLAVKGAKAQQELLEAQQAIKSLRTELKKTVSLASGTMLFFEKVAETPGKYPRRSGEPKHRPL